MRLAYGFCSCLGLGRAPMRFGCVAVRVALQFGGVAVHAAYGFCSCLRSSPCRQLTLAMPRSIPSSMELLPTLAMPNVSVEQLPPRRSSAAETHSRSSAYGAASARVSRVSTKMHCECGHDACETTASG